MVKNEDVDTVNRHNNKEYIFKWNQNTVVELIWIFDHVYGLFCLDIDFRSCMLICFTKNKSFYCLRLQVIDDSAKEKY